MNEELKPCPFCGDTHGIITTDGNGAVLHHQCDGEGPDIRIERPTEPEAIAAWNRRPTPEQSGDARAIPTTPQEMIEFIGSNFDSMQADQWTDEVIPKPAGDLSNVRYLLTVHDLLSAFDWAGLRDAAMDRSALGREG